MGVPEVLDRHDLTPGHLIGDVLGVEPLRLLESLGVRLALMPEPPSRHEGCQHTRQSTAYEGGASATPVLKDRSGLQPKEVDSAPGRNEIVDRGRQRLVPEIEQPVGVDVGDLGEEAVPTEILVLGRELQDALLV